MKEKLTRNIGLKILSVILAAILWVVITNVDDPITTKDFRNVKVAILNSNELESLDKAYEIIENETIDFTVAARRSIIDELTSSDFEVTADFSKLSELYAVVIEIRSPAYGNQIDITEGKHEMMKVELYDLDSKRFRVTVVQKGEPAEGFYVGEKKVDTLVNVSGPINKIERIAKIIAEVDVTGQATGFNTYVEPVAVDEEGKAIDASNLKFSINFVNAEITMYEKKEIAVKVITSGTPADGYTLSNVEHEPITIEIAGTAEALKNIATLTVEESIDGAFENIEKEVNLQNQLASGLILVDENPTAVINITIEKAEKKELTIMPADVKVRNMPDKLRMVPITTSPITITLSGPKDEVAEITASSLKPYIDLSDYATGSHSVTIQVELPRYTTLTYKPKMSIHLMP